LVGPVERDDRLAGHDFIAGKVVVANEGKARLVHDGPVGQLLALQQLGEGVTAVVGVVHLANFDRVVGQEIVDYVGQVIGLAEEAEDFAIVIEELFLAGDLATAEGLLHVLLHLVVAGAGDLDLRSYEGVGGALLGLGLGLAEILKLL
jgi:hypothetical protein